MITAKALYGVLHGVIITLLFTHYIMVPNTIEEIKSLRISLQQLIENTDDIMSSLEVKAAGREIALVKTKLQEARMWAGQALSHFDTGFVPTDMPSE